MSDIDVYIYILGKVKTHTRVRADTHNILYMHVRLQSCIPINMETYPQKQLLYCLILYTCMFLFRLKRLMLQKGKSKCFSWHSRDNISGAWSQIRPWKHCSTQEQQRNKDMFQCWTANSLKTNLLNLLGWEELVLTWEILYALSSVCRFCITVSGYLQCVTVVIPGSETWMPNQCLW